MPKTTTLADKEALLAKMERDRRALAIPMPRSATARRSGSAWARTAALAAGATFGWPRFLRQPLRAMAAVAMRDRVAELMGRMQVRRISDPPSDPDMAALVKMMADVRAAAVSSEDQAEIERLRTQLDAQVRQLRTARASRNLTTPLAAPGSAPGTVPGTAPLAASGTAPTGRDVSAIP